MGIESVAVYSEDDPTNLHVSLASEAHALSGVGAAPYLDIVQLIEAARERGCEAIHPGWGFLSENADFAQACEDAGITFVGPRVQTMKALGDKTQARLLAERCGVPVLKGSGGAVSLDEARAFLATLDGASMLIKAVAGGGGRGMRIVAHESGLESAYVRCQSEAQRAFGNGAVYVEQRLPRARHVEVQIVGDGSTVSHLWERDCSIQRRHQKVVEVAPSPGLSPALRDQLTSDAVRMASELRYSGVGTFEFLVHSETGKYAFIEANARLQVEHTLTEEIVGVDLVRTQLRIAGGESLAALGLEQPDVAPPRGCAIQLRVNMEEMLADGSVRPSSGTLSVFQPPTGPGIRVDTFGYPGYATSSAFDSLLAKVIVHSPGSYEETVARAARALGEFRVEGVATNIGFLRNLLNHEAFRANAVYTTFVDEHIGELAVSADEPVEHSPSGHRAGAQIDTLDPLAVLAYGKSMVTPSPAFGRNTTDAVDRGTVLSPMQGTVVSFEIRVGDSVRKGQEVAVLNAMKMEHVLLAPVSGIVRGINAEPGDTVVGDQALIMIEEVEAGVGDSQGAATIDPDYIRTDLAEVAERHRRTLDEARPEAVARRNKTGHRTARANIMDICDPGTFVEYGPLVLAAQRARRSVEELIEKSPADGMIVGIGSINGEVFGDPESRCLVMSYDYTVFAGTQGGQNHRKTDRMIDVAEQGRMPLVLFAEGGGGRPGDTDNLGGGQRTFARFATLSGLVPMVGITTGRCFAGNASLLGCCDVIIATEGSNIGMGGPAMIEGGGLGIFSPEEIGPMSVQVANGVVDIVATDEADAVRLARQYLSYFQGPIAEWECADQRTLRHAIPENRLRVYDIRAVIETIVDGGSVLEIRKGFGQTMITALARVEGRPIGIIANDPMHLGGAITSDGADKAARFMQICDAFDVPILYLCDTPGIMVGPEIEKTALVRHSSRMFLIGANVTVPRMTIILRKAYGLGAIAMAAGSYKVPYFTVAWPTGEFGGMGLEGSVKLGYRDELAAIEDPAERRKTYDDMVARAYERGKALNEASHFGVDDTIDPADSRFWVTSLLKSVRPAPPREGKKRSAIDGW